MENYSKIDAKKEDEKTKRFNETKAKIDNLIRQQHEYKKEINPYKEDECELHGCVNASAKIIPSGMWGYNRNSWEHKINNLGI